MAVKITTLDEAIEDSGIRIMLYGPSGVGKTFMTSTLPGSILLVNAEGGLLSLKKAPQEVKDRITVSTIAGMEDIGEVYNTMSDPECPYDVVVFDSITEIAEKLLAVGKSAAKDPRHAYGTMADDMIGLIKAFRDMPGKKTVIMIAKQKRFTDDYAGITKYMPDYPGRVLTQGSPYLFDEVFAMRILKDAEGEEHRALQTAMDIQFDAKDRSGNLDRFEPADWSVVFKKIQDSADSPESKPETNEQKPDELKEPNNGEAAWSV